MAKQTSFMELIRRTIKADGRSLYRLAKDSGVNVAILQRVMAGERSMVLDTAERVCRAIGLDLVSVKGR